MIHAILLACFLQGPGSSTAPVVINEFLYDHTSTDDQEFVELYNRSGATVDIGGWTLEAEDPTTTNPSYAIPAGTMLAAGDYYVLGSALVPNVDLVVGATNLWENDNESLTLKNAMGTVIDTLVYESSKGIWNPALAEGPGIYGNITATLSPVVPMTWARLRDGYDTNNNGYDFVQLPRTPGTTNNLSNLLPVLDVFDVGTPGNAIANWEGSFVTPRYVDPTAPDSTNPNAIAPSPQGGNAAMFWDPAGGGNAGPLLSTTGDHFDFEFYYYLEGSAHPVSGIQQWETTSFGVGTSDTFGNHPDPGGALSGMGVTGIVEANTGVAWTYVRFTDLAGVGTNTLYLVDYNDGGGAGTTVLGSFPVSPGTNDGWQRLRLRVNGKKVEGWLGGTLGLNDGTKITGTTAVPVVGPVYFQYRELVSVNANTRPPTIDDFRARRHAPGIAPVVPPSSCLGSGGCVPQIGWDGGTPLAMTAGPYAVTLADAFSPGSAILVIGVTSGAPFPIDLALFVGGNSGNCFTLNDPLVLIAGVPVTGAGACVGTASVPISLAGVPPGGPIFAHWVLFDPGSSLGFPLTASDGFALTVQ